MKRLTIIVLLFLSLNAYSQGGNQYKNLDKLVSEAIKQGPASDGIYQIENKKNLYVEKEFALKQLENKDYLVFESSQKNLVRFGEPMTIVDIIRFAPYDSYPAKKYMFDKLKGDNPTSFDQLKNPGNFFYKKYVDKTIWGYYEGTIYLKSNDIMWSGNTVDGFLDGKGTGCYFIDKKMFLFEGEFVAGFPSKDMTVKKFKSNSFQLNSISFSSVEWMKDTAKGDLRKCVVNYIHKYNSEKALIVNDEFGKALALNSKNGDFSSFYAGKDNQYRIETRRRMFHSLVEINRGMNLSEFPALDSKIKELLKLYDVLSVLDQEFYNKSYITESILWGTTFERSKATKDTARFGITDRYISENAKASSKSSFRKFYAAVEPTMYKKLEALYDNINRQIREYNAMDKTPDIFHQPSTNYASSSSNSSTRKSDRNDDNEKNEAKNSSSDSKKMLSCKVRIKLPDGTFFKGGNAECWIHEGRWVDEGGYVKTWVDGDGNCTVSWEEKRGDYIYEILNIHSTGGKWYHVKGVELKPGGSYTVEAKEN